MPPRNVPGPDAIRNFKCSACNKAYSRQVDLERHLNSYDHNHNVRLAGLRDINAGHQSKASRSKGSQEMRTIANNPANLGPDARSVALDPSRFKKVGVVVSENTDNAKDEVDVKEEKKTQEQHADEKLTGAKTSEDKDAEDSQTEVKHDEQEVKDEAKQDDKKKGEDLKAADSESDADQVAFEAYDFTKPTGCDHAECPGCQIHTEGIWDTWIELEP